jgi:hypothetical protein
LNTPEQCRQKSRCPIKVEIENLVRGGYSQLATTPKLREEGAAIRKQDLYGLTANCGGPSGRRLSIVNDESNIVFAAFV